MIEDLILNGKATNADYYQKLTWKKESLNNVKNNISSIFGDEKEKSKLITNQQSVINDKNYQQGTKGPYGYEKATAETTWCNMATEKITFETSYNLSMALRNENDPYCLNTTANDMYDNLIKASQTKGSGIVEISAEQAQKLANKGYTVVGSWKNKDPKKSGHIATVEPGHEYNVTNGPYFGNVGKSEYTGVKQSAIDCFGANKMSSIKYFYDCHQFKTRRF